MSIEYLTNCPVSGDSLTRVGYLGYHCELFLCGNWWSQILIHCSLPGLMLWDRRLMSLHWVRYRAHAILNFPSAIVGSPSTTSQCNPLHLNPQPSDKLNDLTFKVNERDWEMVLEAFCGYLEILHFPGYKIWCPRVSFPACPSNFQSPCVPGSWHFLSSKYPVSWSVMHFHPGTVHIFPACIIWI